MKQRSSIKRGIDLWYDDTVRVGFAEHGEKRRSMQKPSLDFKENDKIIYLISRGKSIKVEVGKALLVSRRDGVGVNSPKKALRKFLLNFFDFHHGGFE